MHQMFKLISLFALFLISYNTSAQTHSIEQSLAPTLKKVMPAVVHIEVTGSPFWLRSQMPPSKQKNRSNAPVQAQQIGSGVILNAEKGIIVTNAHLVLKAESITVTLNDGRHFMGHLVGLDSPTDLAVITIKPIRLTAIAQTEDTVHVGDQVIAVGSPFGLTQSVTSGIVSGIHRHLGIEGVENFIQTDASINPGNSGGALVNRSGKLIGINTAILSASGGNIGIGFAIPINIVEPITAQLLQYGNVKRGLLGIVAQTLTPALSKALHLKHTEGALINHIIPGSAAEKAGLKVEDLVVKVNEDPITNAPNIKSLAAVLRAGSKVHLTLERAGKILHPTVILSDPSQKTTRHKPSTPQSYLKGLELQNLDRMIDGERVVLGVEVLHTATGSAGWLAGLKPHDIIIAVDHTPVHNLKTFIKQINAPTHHGHLLRVLRDFNKLYLVIET
ncbi:MAG: protease [Legionellales bacterium]|nr:protease [Legionellales bacterium]